MEVNAIATSTPPPAPLPPFVRAPPEDRSKYEKLFCDDFDSDPEDEGGTGSRRPRRPRPMEHGPERNGVQADSNVNGKAEDVLDGTAPERRGRVERSQSKLTDEDSIGSATDLKNGSDEDLDDRPHLK